MDKLCKLYCAIMALIFMQACKQMNKESISILVLRIIYRLI